MVSQLCSCSGFTPLLNNAFSALANYNLLNATNFCAVQWLQVEGRRAEGATRKAALRKQAGGRVGATEGGGCGTRRGAEKATQHGRALRSAHKPPGAAAA